MTTETKTRLITAFIVAPFVVVCFISYKSLIGLVAAVVLLASYELLNMAVQGQNERSFVKYAVTICVSFVVAYGVMEAKNGLLLLSLAFILTNVIAVLTQKNVENVWPVVVATGLALVYVAGCLSFFFPMYLEFGAANALLNLTAVWLYDTGAYFVGMRWGKTKISKKFSPNKSLEGVIGGFLSALAFSFLYKFVFDFIFKAKVMPFGSLVILSAIIAILDTFGDLFESALKRYFKVKDSGSVLPGHGGMLDRIDGLLFVTPVTYFLLSIGVL
ncbi:phosphatidate cytidylyltransferase [Thermotoga sp. Ku-13t]|uniref:phosphatidate cytidylyltransferase n=1 Tax=Thermotoga sp. Ku-13t TaxID=1755813 RepID=UPI0013EB4855|nr:phosphatidate cytidylyltransferase [Thermotoga sp. Ku-13t]KAF2958977.1 phosphatidate cytidylyltransferase [Thermotoga sp. Ku-13t]